MSDLIERQAAIDEAEEWIETYNSGRGGQRERDAIKHVISGIKKLPSVQPDPNALEQEYLKGWEDGRKNLLDAVSGTLEDFCEQCGEGKKYNGVMCGACNLDSWMSAIEEMKCTIEGKPNEHTD